MQRPWGKICDLKQVWYHLIPQWASPQIPWEHWGPFWDLCDCHTQLLWSWLVPFHALKLHLPMVGAFIPDGRTWVWMKRHRVFLPGFPGPALGSPIWHGHSRFAQFPDFLYRKRHLGHTLPCTKKSRDYAFALTHFGYMHLGFSQSALFWRVFIS